MNTSRPTGWIALGVALLSGSALVLLSEQLIRQAEYRRQAAQQQLSAAHHALSTARTDHEFLPGYVALYLHLQARHILGDADPLLWQAQLEALRRQHPGLQYTLAAGQPYGGAAPGPYTQTLSPVSLRLDLLHEGQLLRALDTLRASEDGWFLLERCTLERTAPEETVSRLNAECAGGWLTLNRAQTS